MQVTEVQVKTFVDTFSGLAEGFEAKLGRTGLVTATKDLQKAIESPIGLTLVTLGINALLGKIPADLLSVVGLLAGEAAPVVKAA